MNGCRKYEDLLARYLHGESLLQDREELEKHLAVCPDCENLYRDVTDIDRALREFPGKLVEPPPFLRSRIVANLPDEGTPLGVRWGRWAMGLGTVAAGLLALFLGLYRGTGLRVERVASAPAPAGAPQPPAATETDSAPRPPESAKAPVRSAAPGGEQRTATVVASSPKVQVIKEVKIFFYFPPAQKVAVTGDFNNWDADGVQLTAAGKPGLWETELRIPPGVYSYNFIVDGELLVPDPNAANQMPDGYGGTNSILLVKGESTL